MLRKIWQSDSTKEKIRDYGLIIIGTLFQAIALRVFLVPSNLASGGVSGLSQIINHYTGWPIGLMTFIGNVPLFILGWRFLGGTRFALRTAVAVISFSLFADNISLFLPSHGLTDNMTINALYGGVVSGIGFGLVYQGRGTSGGSDILAKILNHWRGVSFSTSYLLTDALIMFLAGISFSWEHALYALLMLYISGVSAETIAQGVNVARTALIITNKPERVTEFILNQLERGVTLIPAKGGYTNEERTILYCVVSKSEVASLKTLVHEADDHAFMVIGDAYEALGEGFKSLKEK